MSNTGPLVPLANGTFANQAIFVDANGNAVAPGPGLTINNVTGTTQSAVVNNGYIANNASLCTITLPATASIGSVIGIVGSGAGGWKLAQNAGQLIHFNAATTTTGTGGSLASGATNNCVEVVCVVANTTWVVRSSVGTLTVT